MQASLRDLLAGYRRDEDVNVLASTAAGHFDCYLCEVDDNLRGRGDAEIPEMIRNQLILKGVDKRAIEMIFDEKTSVARALDHSGTGDLLVIFGDDVTRCWKQIIEFKTDGSGREVESQKEKISEFASVLEQFLIVRWPIPNSRCTWCADCKNRRR